MSQRAAIYRRPIRPPSGRPGRLRRWWVAPPAAPEVTGTAAAALGLTTTISGIGEALGQAAATLGLTGTAAGVPTKPATAAATLGLTATASGVSTKPGTAGTTLGLTATAAGVPTKPAAAAATLAVTGTILGVAEGVKVGTAAATLAVTATATGLPDHPGQASTALGLTATATAIPDRPGQAAAALGLTATALGIIEGANEVTGTAAAVLTPTATIAGVRVRPGTAAALLTTAATVAGIVEAGWVPQNLTATPVGASQVDLAWDAVAAATGGYDIERGGVVIVAGHPTASYSDTGLTAATLYTYRVRSVEGSGIVPLTATDDLQDACDGNPAGTIFLLAPGTYRPGANYPAAGLDPQPDQQLRGDGLGVVLSGALALTSWTAAGADWWAPRASGTLGSQPDDPGDGNRCAIGGCENRNDVFYDGTPLVRVTSLGALAAGKFYEDFAANRVYIRDTPSGHLVEQAVASRLIHSTNPGIQVHNLVCEMAANAAQTGAVEADGTGWLIEHNDVRYNHGHGVGTNGDGSTVRRNLIHHQMQMGIGGEGADVLVEYNELHHNNRDNSYLRGWEAGGSKWALCNGLILRGNWSHHENGIGLWCDINLGNTLIEDNYVHDNAEWGIFYEIAYGEETLGDGLKTHIRDNVSFDNYPTSPQGFYSGGQIVVSGSRDCEVYGNTIRGQDGIGGLAQVRTDHPDSRGSHQLHNLHVYDNDLEVVWDGAGFANLSGIQTDDPAQTNGVYTSQGNTFEGNRYYVPSGSQQYWTWINDFETWAAWQALGNDDSAGGGTRTVGGHVTIPSPPTLNAGPQP